MHDLILDGCERPVVDFEESWRWQCIDTLSFHAIWLPMIHALWHVCLSWVQKSGSVKNDLLLDFSFCLFLIWRVAIERIDHKASLSLFYRDFLSNQSIQDSFMQGGRRAFHERPVNYYYTECHLAHPCMCVIKLWHMDPSGK
jgi:hypothetical protein